MICGIHGADLFENLYEAQDVGGKAMACVSDTYFLEKTPRSCRGVLWRQSRLLVRASCLRHARVAYVQKGIANCTLRNSTTSSGATYCDDELCVRFVTAVYLHCRHPDIDVAMLHLDAPYLAERRAFSADLERALDEWENFIADLYTTTAEGAGQIRHYQMFTTPVKMFLATVMFPTCSFILFFVYVIFYMGASDKTMFKEIPYAHLKNEEETKRRI